MLSANNSAKQAQCAGGSAGLHCLTVAQLLASPMLIDGPFFWGKIVVQRVSQTCRSVQIIYLNHEDLRGRQAEGNLAKET